MGAKKEVREEVRMLQDIRGLVDALKEINGETEDVKYSYFMKRYYKSSFLRGEFFDKSSRLNVSFEYDGILKSIVDVVVETLEGESLHLKDFEYTLRLFNKYAYHLIRKVHPSVVKLKENQESIENRIIETIESAM